MVVKFWTHSLWNQGSRFFFLILKTNPRTLRNELICKKLQISGQTKTYVTVAYQEASRKQGTFLQRSNSDPQTDLENFTFSGWTVLIYCRLAKALPAFVNQLPYPSPAPLRAGPSLCMHGVWTQTEMVHEHHVELYLYQVCDPEGE